MKGPFKIEKYTDFGTGEPWVARIVIGLRELTFAVPAFVETREPFMDEIAGGVFASLGKAFENLGTLRALVADEDTPALTLVKTYESVYAELWRAYKSRFQKALKVLGLDIGFLFKTDNGFDRDAATLLAAHPELADLVDLMRRDRIDFQQKLATYRNEYLEHQSAYPDPAMITSFHRLDSAESMFENVWHAIEEYVVLYATARLPTTIHIVEIPEDERDLTRPTRFRFGVDAPT